MTTHDVISQPEVVGILYRCLGPSRAWSDFLADCSREKSGTNFLGLQLHPLCCVKVETDRCKRPYYVMSDVLEFIGAAIAAHGTSGPDRRLIRRKRQVTMDPAELARPHRVRKARLLS